MRKGIRYNSPVVLTFALLGLLALLLDKLTAGLTTAKLFCVYRSPLSDALTYPRFFLHVLGHNGISHYLSNMLLFLVVGPSVEERYGSKKLLISMLICAFITGLVQFIFFPGSALLGASGIVFMMIVMLSITGTRGSGIPLTMVLVLALYIGKEILAGVTSIDNISQLTHIIGGVCGLVLGLSYRHGR